MKKILLSLLVIACALPMSAQRIESGYILSNDLKDGHGNKVGRGAVQYMAGSYTMPLATTKVEQIKNIYRSTTTPDGKTIIRETRDTVTTARMWQLTLTGKYAAFDNEGTAMQNHPDDAITAGAMITHVCPIAHRWNLIATVGATLNAPSSYIRMQSIAITAGMIFQYRVNKNLSLGIGAVSTTAYGEPVILPVPMINWKRDGRYSIELNMHGKPQLTIATQLNEKTRLTLAPFDTERFSAMVDIDGEHKVFAQNIIQSTIGVSYRFTNHWSLTGEAGYIYHNSIRIQERSMKAFWEDLFSDDNRMKYSPSCTFSVGLHYHFR
ncbi:MAG: hypothetical protein IJC92_01760 [Bacteroidaceae bacterium]|nr:hypothetical protein [Bacteroidaceae bacterium]